MSKRCRMLWWAARAGAGGLVWSLAFTAAAQPAAPSPAALQATMSGRWTGTSTCSSPRSMAIQFDKAEVQGSGVVLRGTAKGEPDIDANVVGRYDLASGLLSIDGTVVPDDPNYCAGTRVLGKCMELTVGTVITPQKTKEKHQQQRAALTKTSTFEIDVTRDEEGAALSGTIRGPAFECATFKLSKSDRAVGNALPVHTAESDRAAMARIDATGGGAALENVRARLVWLESLSKRGDPIAMADLGRQYEVGSAAVGSDLTKAVAWYTKAAQAGEARAQRRLADLYAKGQGVPKDASESDRWSTAAKATAAEVGRYCVAPAMLDGYMELFDSLKKDSTNMLVGAATSMLMGVAIDEGTMRIEGAGIEEVTLRDGPFLCRIAARRVGASVRNITPSFTYAGVSNSGYDLYYDNSAQAASNEALASIATQLMSKSQMTQGFQVVQMGNNRFHVTLVQQLISTGHTHATDVIIDPATLVSANAAGAAPATTPVMPPSALPPLPTSPAPEPGRAAPQAQTAAVGSAAIDPQRERAVWSLCQTSTGPAMCQAYLSEFPNGPHGGQARGILSDMSTAGAASSTRVVAAPMAAIDANGKDDSAILAAVNAGFVQWSREWQYDHYLGNSAVLKERRCGGAACQVGGSLRFQRMNQPLALTYTANVTRQSDGRIGITRACYSDPSSGMSDCHDF